MAAVVQGAGLIGLTLPLSWAERVVRQATAWTGNRDLERALPSLIEPLRLSLRAALRSHPAARRSYALVEIVTANLFGIMVDGLLTRPDGFGAINHLDYREWLLGHGIDPEALESPILRGMYDLVFGYEGGDPARPRFSAGLGLELATKMLLGYSGALFWKMQAGMGEVIFAPLYEVLRDRGVEFRFFHRVDALRLADDGRSIAAIDLGLQAELADGVDAYDPLIRVKGLPCWPDAPLDAQLRATDALDGVDLESFWSPRRDVGRRTLEAGKDFDAVVFAISLGMVPHVCGELLAASPAWRSMVENVGTVATQAFQLWLSEDEEALGWSGPPGVTVSGFVKPFDTWASMPHLLAAEDWPEIGATADDRLLLQRPGHAGFPGRCARCRGGDTRRAGAGADLPRPRRGDAVAGRGRPRRIPMVPACATARRRPPSAPSDSTASTGGRTSTPPTSTCSRCPAPTSTACSRAAPASATSPWRATGRTTG